MLISLVALPLFAPSITSQELERIIGNARETNSTFITAVQDYDLALLRNEQDLILAESETDRLTAEASLLQERVAFASARRAFLIEVTNAAFGVVLAELDLQLASATAELADSDVTSTREQVEAGLAPNRDLLDAELEARSAVSNAERARFGRDTALDELRRVGGPSRTLTLSVVPRPSLTLVSEEEWIEGDLSTQIGRATLALAVDAERRLPADAPRFSTQLAQANVESAQATLETALFNAANAYESLKRRIEFQRDIIGIETERLVQNQLLLEDSEVTAREGLLSQADLDRVRIGVLNAERSLVQEQAAYVQALIEYAVGTDTQVEDLL